jgi:arylsulfatase A-like enzyme
VGANNDRALAARLGRQLVLDLGVAEDRPMPSLRSRSGFAAILAILSGSAAACGAYEQDPATPSIVLVLVDQLRKDAADRWMPEVRALADRGVVVENMRAAAPWTYPSVISLFSGLYPQQHGANGEPVSGRRLATFDPRVPLLPAILSGRGRDVDPDAEPLAPRYYTAGFVTNPFLQRWHSFHEGFDHYAIDEFVGSMGNLRGFPGLAWTSHMFADSVNRVLLEHFDGREVAGPEFVYVHYIDVHGPWENAPFDAGPPLPENALNEPAYEAGARYVDHKIAELHEYFTRRYEGNLLFLVTSDHGQELGDDLELGEGEPLRKRKASVHDFNTHIPLLVLPGRSVPSGRRVRIPCSNVDVVPTLLDWLGMPVPPDLAGASLKHAILGEERPEDWQRPIYSRMEAFNCRSDGVVVGTKKLVRYLDPETGAERRRVAFDLEADAREANALEAEFGPPAAELDDVSSTRGIEYEARFEDPDAETIEKLRALGYFGQ